MGRSQTNPLSTEETVPSLKEGTAILRKVSRSGHISYKSHLYFVTKALAGKTIRLLVTDDSLILDISIPMRKEYRIQT